MLEAVNHQLYATTDDGSCEFASCYGCIRPMHGRRRDADLVRRTCFLGLEVRSGFEPL